MPLSSLSGNEANTVPMLEKKTRKRTEIVHAGPAARETLDFAVSSQLAQEPDGVAEERELMATT